MSIALRGNLEDFGVGEVFQLIGQQRKTGVLEISNEAGRIQLRFDAGSVVAAAPVGEQPGSALGEMLVRRGVLSPESLATALAECAATLQGLGQRLAESGMVSKADVDDIEEFLTRETIFDLLRLSQGSFHFTAQPVMHDRDPAALLGAEQILMDGLRMVDEWRTLARGLPPEDATLRRKRNFDVYAAAATGEARRRLVTAERVYLLVDGRATLRRVIDLSHLGTFEASRIVAELIAGGVVEPVKRKQPVRLPPRTEEEIRPRRSAGGRRGPRGPRAPGAGPAPGPLGARGRAGISGTALADARQGAEAPAPAQCRRCVAGRPRRVAGEPRSEVVEAGWVEPGALTSTDRRPVLLPAKRGRRRAALARTLRPASQPSVSARRYRRPCEGRSCRATRPRRARP